MEIRSVAVLGAGQMGLGIAQATARAGFETIMAKATPGGVDAQRGRVEKQLQKDLERGKLTAADHGALLERGLGSIAGIDAAMQNGANHPMGPLALADFIGLDIVFHMSSLLLEEYREPRFTPPPLLRRMVLAGYLGRKSGLGFYDYKQTPPAAHDAVVQRAAR